MANGKIGRRVGIAALVLAAGSAVIFSVPSLRTPVVNGFNRLFGLTSACDALLTEADDERLAMTEYLQNNPDGECAPAFRQALDAMDCAALNTAADKRQAYTDYLDAYGEEGSCYEEVMEAMDLLDCEDARKANTKEAYDAYLSKYGDEGSCSAHFKAEMEDCVAAEEKNNCEAYLDYVEKYPDGVCYDYFLDRLAQLDCDVSGIQTADFTADNDNDGLSNWEERKYGSDPNNPDSDNDGVNDGEEVRRGTNPAGSGPLRIGNKTVAQSGRGPNSTNIPDNIPTAANRVSTANLSCRTFPNPNGASFQAVKFGPLWIMTDDANYRGQTLFTWEDAHRNACPEGFRLPCEQEMVFYVNEYYRGNPSDAYRGFMGIDACGFNTKIYNNYYRGNASTSLASGVISQFWLATESSDLWAYSFGMDRNREQFFVKDNTNKEIKLPCRCVKESDDYARSKISIKYKGCPNWPFPELRK